MNRVDFGGEKSITTKLKYSIICDLAISFSFRHKGK